MPGGKWTGYGTLVPSAVGFWPGAKEPGSFTGSFHQGLIDKPILTSIGLLGSRIPHGIGATYIETSASMQNCHQNCHNTHDRL